MGSQPSNPRRHGNQNRSLRSVVPSLHRAIDWNHRREYLDRLLFWTATDLELKLLSFRDYYNRYRTHSALDGQTPMKDPEPKRAELKLYRWQAHCRELYKTPIAA